MVTPTFVITRLTTLRCGKAHDERDSGGAYSQLDRDYGLQPRESMQIFSLARMVASCSHSIDDRSQSHSEPLGIRMNHQHLPNGVRNNVTKMPARSLEVVACSTRRNEPLSFLLHPLSVRCPTAYSSFSRMAQRNHATLRQSSWWLIRTRVVTPLTADHRCPVRINQKASQSVDPSLRSFILTRPKSERRSCPSNIWAICARTLPIPSRPWTLDGEYNFSGLSATMECGNASQPNGNVSDASSGVPVTPSFHTPGMVPPLCPVVPPSLISRLDPDNTIRDFLSASSNDAWNPSFSPHQATATWAPPLSLSSAGEHAHPMSDSHIPSGTPRLPSSMQPASGNAEPLSGGNGSGSGSMGSSTIVPLKRWIKLCQGMSRDLREEFFQRDFYSLERLSRDV
ncbi:hypothetical protein BKA83DRAFT_4558701 [Pisolithus microcarpus]|nr:hypothetical protein BKA83DRAFT_4558701 [Pisolithus microcarpus]